MRSKSITIVRKVVKVLIYPFSTLAVAGLLLSYLSSFISPTLCWPIAFFGLFFQVFIIINLVFAFFWFCFRKKRAWIHVAAIALGIPYISLFLQFNSQSKLLDDYNLKVLSYNVHIFNSHKQKATYKEVAEFLNTQNADIICLQEFYVSEGKLSSSEAFKQLLRGKYYSHVFYNIQKKKSKFGLAVFSRYPIVGKGDFPFAKSTNAAMYVDVDVEGKRVRVYNNHLQSTSFNLAKSLSRFAKEEERISELVDASTMIKSAFMKRAVQVDSISSSIASSPYPTIVCGDFNDMPVSYTYRTMKAGLIDAFVAAGRGMPSTYRGFIPSFRIDYIFHDKSMKAVDFKVIKENLSDHYPITTKLIL